jgi:murein DD-endopeptidase MepM/ murein hydrolase activator NlpD
LSVKSKASNKNIDPALLSARLLAPELWLRLAVYGLVGGLLLSALWFARKDVKDAPGVSSDNSTLPPASSAATIPLAPVEELSDVTRFAEVHTNIPTRPRYNVITYTVVKNDTLFIIANKFNLKPETMVWGNPALAEDPNNIFPGQALNVLPVDGALRVVQPGDRLDKIVQVFHGKLEDIVNYPGNDLDPSDPQIRPGQYLIIPGGWRDTLAWQLPVVTRKTVGRAYSGDPGACAGPFSGPHGTFTFIWPAGNHYLSGTDFLPKAHPGIDISAWLGAPIYASDTGVVIFSGWSNFGYGNLVMIDHGNGWQTVYAHLSQISVGCNASVNQGQVIGLAGSTGRSTGAHLHFEMRSDTYGRVNPWLYLPAP